MGVIDEQSKGITVRDEDKEFIARIYSYVFIGIMLDWIKGNMKDDPRLIIDKLALLIKDYVSDALNRFNQNARFDKNLYNLQCCAKDFSTALFLFIERSRKCGYNKDRK